MEITLRQRVFVKWKRFRVLGFGGPLSVQVAMTKAHRVGIIGCRVHGVWFAITSRHCCLKSVGPRRITTSSRLIVHLFWQRLPYGHYSRSTVRDRGNGFGRRCRSVRTRSVCIEGAAARMGGGKVLGDPRSQCMHMFV